MCVEHMLPPSLPHRDQGTEETPWMGFLGPIISWQSSPGSPLEETMGTDFCIWGYLRAHNGSSWKPSCCLSPGLERQTAFLREDTPPHPPRARPSLKRPTQLRQPGCPPLGQLPRRLSKLSGQQCLQRLPRVGRWHVRAMRRKTIPNHCLAWQADV